MTLTLASRLIIYPYKRLTATWGGTVKIIELIEENDSRRRYTACVADDCNDVNSIIHIAQNRQEEMLILDKCYNLQGSVICDRNRRITTIWLEDQLSRNARDGGDQCGMCIYGKGMVLSDLAIRMNGIQEGWRVTILKHREWEWSSFSFVEFNMEYMYCVPTGVDKLTRGDIITFDGTLIGKGTAARMWLSELCNIVIVKGGSNWNRSRPDI